MIVRSRAPLRIGLAGGGTDVSPFCDEHGGCVINATINLYAHVTIKHNIESKVIFNATDLGLTESYNLESIITLNNDLTLHSGTYNFIVEKFNNGEKLPVIVSTYCDAPKGSGLGSSSTLVVAMIKAYSEYLKFSLDDYETAKFAYIIERDICGFAGGRQDQYAASFGGFNFMEFQSSNSIVNPLRIKNWIISELESSIVLFYTGVSRDSAKIITDQSKKISVNNNSFEAMDGLKQEAVNMKKYILNGDFTNIANSINKGWNHKKNSSKYVSNKSLDQIYNDAINHGGALAGKITGAGGGGFFIFFVNPENKMKLFSSLKKYEGFFINCHFTFNGSQSWRIN